MEQRLDIGKADYLGNVKPTTLLNYEQHIKNHIRPGLGAIRSDALDARAIQKFYNGLGSMA